MTQKAHYYLMYNKFILRLEPDQQWDELPTWIKQECISAKHRPMNQDEANFRVSLYRDRIVDFQEFVDFNRLVEVVAL